MTRTEKGGLALLIWLAGTWSASMVARFWAELGMSKLTLCGLFLMSFAAMVVGVVLLFEAGDK